MYYIYQEIKHPLVQHQSNATHDINTRDLDFFGKARTAVKDESNAEKIIHIGCNYKSNSTDDQVIECKKISEDGENSPIY